MVQITAFPRTERFRRLMRAWPLGPMYEAAFLLRAPSEPYQLPPVTLALVRVDGVVLDLIGAFTYRKDSPFSAFVGLVLAPGARGRGLALPSMLAGLEYLRVSAGCRVAWGSVAAANRPALRMDLAAGFVVTPGLDDWRMLPAGFDVSILVRFPTETYSLGSEVLGIRPMMRYFRVVCSL